MYHHPNTPGALLDSPADWWPWRVTMTNPIVSKRRTDFPKKGLDSLYVTIFLDGIEDAQTYRAYLISSHTQVCGWTLGVASTPIPA